MFQDAETRFEDQLSKLVLEKQELEWEKVYINTYDIYILFFKYAKFRKYHSCSVLFNKLLNVLSFIDDWLLIDLAFCCMTGIPATSN